MGNVRFPPRNVGNCPAGSEGLNTAIFYVIALGGILPTNILIEAILWGWLLKVTVEVVLTPLTYFVIAQLKRAEGIDTDDYSERYRIFKV